MIANGFRAWGMALVVVAVGLAGCSSGTPDVDPASLIGAARDPAAEQAALEKYAAVTVCPPVQVRDGTQLFRVFERGKENDLTGVRFQASITKFARECHTDRATGATTVKVGVAGRLLNGPNGATGAATLPLRVVLVKNGDEVLYSQLRKVTATIAPGGSGVTWTEVVDGLAIPPTAAEANYVVYVGFDEGPAKS